MKQKKKKRNRKGEEWTSHMKLGLEDPSTPSFILME
jgi:hypothetical protein